MLYYVNDWMGGVLLPIQAKVRASPRWHGAEPRMIHAVAFPETDRATIAGHGRDLGPDAPGGLILDRADLADEAAARRALQRVLSFWSGDGTRDRPLSDEQLATIPHSPPMIRKTTERVLSPGVARGRPDDPRD